MSTFPFSRLQHFRVSAFQFFRGYAVPFLLSALVGSASLATSRCIAAEFPDEKPGAEGDGKVTVGPAYQIDPDLTDRGNPKGKSFEFTMRLADSKIFPGNDSTLNPEKKQVRKERRIFVYVPAAYK